MARPRKCRRVCGMPRTNSFAPMGSQLCEERIIMAVDEYETIRLIDLAGYTQEECAAQMGIARTTVQGIMSIDEGQFEAGRSLGFNYVQTMRYIIIPQAFKNVLPALANEFIVLLKETSVAGYVGLADLTKGGDIIRSRTFQAFMPLIGVAVIYLVMVMFFTWLVGILERRLRDSER